MQLEMPDSFIKAMLCLHRTAQQKLKNFLTHLNSGCHARRCNFGAMKGACWPEAGKGDAIDGLHSQHPPQ
jgi:hypothetical protein